MRTDVILASFSENVVVAVASYQILGTLSPTDREGALPPATEMSELTFVAKKKTKQNKTMKLREQSRKRKIKCLPRSGM